MSGHMFFKERWYGFDDGLYAGARMLEILSRAADIDAVFDALPDSLTTPELQIRVDGRDAPRAGGTAAARGALPRRAPR
jgi:phosphomannomutase